MSAQKKSSGFTLVELMVAISIVAILATIGLTLFTQAQKSARDSKRISDMQEIQQALEQYYVANGNQYPASLNSLNTYFQTQTLPTDPVNSGVYQYSTYFQNCSNTAYSLCVPMETNPGNASGNASNCVITSGSSKWYCISSLSN